jgi:hypothetical protein
MKGKTTLLLLLSFFFIASSCSAQQYKPPKVGQIAWQRYGDNIYLAVEITNENSDVGLYRAPISVIFYNENGKIIGTNMFYDSYGKIYKLLPNEKIIYTYDASLGKENPANIKVTFPELKWISFSNVNIPKASISDENFVKREFSNKFFCMIINESEYKLDFYIVIAFYTDNDQLWSADFGLAEDVPAKSIKPYETSISLNPPEDAKLVVKAYPTKIPDLEK